MMPGIVGASTNSIFIYSPPYPRSIPVFSRCVLLCVTLLALPTYAQSILPALQRFHNDGSVPPQTLGRVLTQELNCVACHVHPQLKGKQAPILTDVASRINPDYLQRFIAQPQIEKPGTTMPSLFSGLTDHIRDNDVAAIVHYLMSLGDTVSPQQYASFGSRRRGETLFHQVGCAACHDPRTEDAVPLPNSVPLGAIETKYNLPALSSFLRNPTPNKTFRKDAKPKPHRARGRRHRKLLTPRRPRKARHRIPRLPRRVGGIPKLIRT